MTVKYRRHPELRLTELEGEGVVLHLGTRRYFTVSESGLTMLNALEESRSCDDLVEALLNEYEVSREEAARSVDEFVDRCESANLLIRE